MKTKFICLLVGIALLLGLYLVAQEHYTEGPVWRVTLISVKPNQMDAYLTSLRQGTKPLLDEEKKEGLIMDYKVFLKKTSTGREDWDVRVTVEYKNHAGLDGGAARNEAVLDQVMGGKQHAQRLGER